MTTIINNNNNTTTTTNDILVGKNNELIIKLLFPPTSSLASKFMYVSQNQKVFDVICYATSLSGLQPGYSLYLPASNSTGRGQWLDDDSLLISYPITSGAEIFIKKKPGSMKRKNTMMTIKAHKEGKVQKLSSITKIWAPRYLRLYSQRLVHSSKENDSNTDFISFADITNVDRHSRLYTFIIYCNNSQSNSSSSSSSSNNNNNSNNKENNNNNSSSNSGTLTHSQTKLNLLSTSLNPSSFSDSKKEKEYIFRCINQHEMEDWISSIRSMLRKSRPDLLLPPLSVNIHPQQQQTHQPVISAPIVTSPYQRNLEKLQQSLNSTSTSPTSVSPTSSSPPKINITSSVSAPTTPTKPKNNNSSNSNSEKDDNPLSESLLAATTTTLPSVTPTKTRSFSFSIGGSREKKKKDQPSLTPMKLPPPVPQLTLSEKNEQLEEEIRKLRDSLNLEAKRKEELDKKYQKIKTKMAALKKSRARATSTPATPEPSRKQSFISSFIIGSSRTKDNSKDNKDNSSIGSSKGDNNNNNSSTSIPLSQSTNNLASHKRHSSTNSQSFSSSILNLHQQQQFQFKDEDTENDMTSSEVFTNSIFDDLNEEDSEKEKEIKELKDQLLKLKDKLNIEVGERNKSESSNKQLEKDLYTQKKLEERKEREIIAINQRQEDNLDSLAELTNRLKKSLFELKNKLEKEIEIEQQQQQDGYSDYEDYDNGDQLEDNNDVQEEKEEEEKDDEEYINNQYQCNQKEIITIKNHKEDERELNNQNGKRYRNNQNENDTSNYENDDDDEELEIDYSDGELNRVLDDDDDDDNNNHNNNNNNNNNNINQSNPIITTTASIKEDMNYNI